MLGFCIGFLIAWFQQILKDRKKDLLESDVL
jgi:hypothetical protein